MINMQGRTAIVFGVANKRSIRLGHRQQLSGRGAKIVITYQNERLEQEAKGLIARSPRSRGLSMRRIQPMREIDQLFSEFKSRFGKIHTLVHSVAYAPRTN